MFDHIEFTTPRVNAGQIVTVSYGQDLDGDQFVRRTHDASDGTITYAVCSLQDAWEYWDDNFSEGWCKETAEESDRPYEDVRAEYLDGGLEPQIWEPWNEPPDWMPWKPVYESPEFEDVADLGDGIYDAQFLNPSTGDDRLRVRWERTPAGAIQWLRWVDENGEEGPRFTAEELLED